MSTEVSPKLAEERALDAKLVSRLPDFQFPFGTTPLEDGTTVVSETRLHRIRVFLCDGTDIGPIGERGNAPGHFEEPRGSCALNRSEIAVADTGNARVQIIRVHDGRPIRTVSGGKLERPWDVASSPDGRLFVCDMAKNTIIVFSQKGQMLQVFKGSSFDGPCRVEYHPHSNNLHVADKSSTRVHEVSLAGHVLRTRPLHDIQKPW